jgi:hypothetical protein
MDKFERYWKLSDMEERFNASSGGIRALASAWILAAIGSIGWLFNSYNFLTWAVPQGLLMVMISTLASLGISTLWVLDQHVFQRLLNSVFLVGLKLEKDDPELPPIRSMMIKTQEGSGASKWQLLFYIVPIAIFTSFSFLLIFFGMDKMFISNAELFKLQARLVSWICLSLQIISLIWIFVNRKTVKSFVERASWFTDEEFTEIVSSSSYHAIIEKFHKNANRHKSTDEVDHGVDSPT